MPKNTLRSIDELMVDYCTVVLSTSGAELTPVIAAPKPMWAQQKHVNSDGKLVHSSEQSKLRLPAVSLHRPWDMEVETAIENRSMIRNIQYSRDGNLIKVAQIPLWYRIPYQLDFWGRYVADANDFFITIHQKNPKKIMTRGIELEGYSGRWYVGVELESITDNSDLEGTMEERQIRYTVTYSTHAPIQFLPEWRRTVRKAVSEVHDYSQEPGDGNFLLSVELAEPT